VHLFCSVSPSQRSVQTASYRRLASSTLSRCGWRGYRRQDGQLVRPEGKRHHRKLIPAGTGFHTYKIANWFAPNITLEAQGAYDSAAEDSFDETNGMEEMGMNN